MPGKQAMFSCSSGDKAWDGATNRSRAAEPGYESYNVEANPGVSDLKLLPSYTKGRPTQTLQPEPVWTTIGYKCKELRLLSPGTLKPQN